MIKKLPINTFPNNKKKMEKIFQMKLSLCVLGYIFMGCFFTCSAMKISPQASVVDDVDVALLQRFSPHFAEIYERTLFGAFGVLCWDEYSSASLVMEDDGFSIVTNVNIFLRRMMMDYAYEILQRLSDDRKFYDYYESILQGVDRHVDINYFIKEWAEVVRSMNDICAKKDTLPSDADVRDSWLRSYGFDVSASQDVL